jgi:uncharacterized protein YaaW (UPF0174 family)
MAEGRLLDELRSVLELATEDELRQLTQLLFCRKLNPLDYFKTPEPFEVELKGGKAWLAAIEERFRYLAADGFTVIRGKAQEFSYRRALIQVCHYLKVPYSNEMTTVDIEAEIFLCLMGKAWKKLPAKEQKSLTVRIQNSLAQSQAPQPLPVSLQHNPMNLLLKGSGVLALNSVVKSWVLQQIARQFAIHFTTYQMAKQALIRGGVTAAGQIQSQIAIQAAKRGMVASAARYGSIRTVFAFVGPVLWGLLVADLGWRAIATNHGRIIPAVFALAQIRLTRSECLQIA